MQELIDALDTIIRRIVREQAMNRDVFSGFMHLFLASDQGITLMKEAVRNASLDQPWFDDAIKSEVVIAVDESKSDASAELVIGSIVSDPMFIDRVISLVNASAIAPPEINRMISQQLTAMQVVTDDNINAKHLVRLHDLDEFCRSRTFIDAVKNVIDEIDLDDKIENTIGNMSFAISVN